MQSVRSRADPKCACKIRALSSRATPSIDHQRGLLRNLHMGLTNLSAEETGITAGSFSSRSDEVGDLEGVDCGLLLLELELEEYW